MSKLSSVNRRQFLGALSAAGAVAAAPQNAKAQGRSLGPNDTINLAVIGVGGRGNYLARVFHELGQVNNQCRLVAVCDVWEKRRRQAAETYGAQGYLDYREVLARTDLDGVVIATPDHWHAPIALAAMDRAMDVYVEKPMCHTLEEAKQLMEKVKATGRVLQVGSQTTSSDQWHKAKKAIADGMIGEMLMSQGSYHRNSVEGEWNWPIDANAGPEGKGDNYIDWRMWLGNAELRAWDPDRYFRFRKYWDYSGGIATDLFYHVVAPLNICWTEPQTPHKVYATGGIYAFPDREVPDTYHLMAEYPKGHSLVLSSSMANSQHIPGLIRGHQGTLIMVEHGRFEGYAPYITIRPEPRVIDEAYRDRWGSVDIQIPVEDTPREKHMQNFLDCMRSRQKPTLDVVTASAAQVTVTMSVLSYRKGKVLYFDADKWAATEEPVAKRA